LFYIARKGGMCVDRKSIAAKLDLTLTRLQNLQRPANEEEIAGSAPDGGKSVGLHRRDFGMENWDWPQGVGLYGMYRLWENSRRSEIWDYTAGWYERHISEELPARNINTTAPLLALSFMAGDLPGKYMDLCRDWADWLMDGLPRTKENGFQHTTTNNAALRTLNLNEQQLWVDTLFMACLFLANMGVVADNKRYRDEASYQFLLQTKYLYDKKERLFHHGWSFNENGNYGGVFWARGNCWYTAASMDYLEITGDMLDGSVREFLAGSYRAQVSRLAQLQDGSGLWHTVLDDPDSYTEVSGSAGFAYGILKGIRSGILPGSFMPVAERAIAAILENIDETGTVNNVSAGTAIGRDRDHYRNIIKAPMAYGQSLAILALSQAMI